MIFDLGLLQVMNVLFFDSEKKLKKKIVISNDNIGYRVIWIN